MKHVPIKKKKNYKTIKHVKLVKLKYKIDHNNEFGIVNLIIEILNTYN